MYDGEEIHVLHDCYPFFVRVREAVVIVLVLMSCLGMCKRNLDNLLVQERS
jgi:hypothetical protein